MAHEEYLGKTQQHTHMHNAKLLKALCIMERTWARQEMGRKRGPQGHEQHMSRRLAVRRCIGFYFCNAVGLVSELQVG